MASTARSIRVIFDGSVACLSSAARRARTEIAALEKDTDKIGRTFDKAFGSLGKGALGITGLTSAAQTAAAKGPTG